MVGWIVIRFARYCMILPISKEGNISTQKARQEESKPNRSFHKFMNQKPRLQITRSSIFDFEKNRGSDLPHKEKTKKKEKNSFNHTQPHIETLIETQSDSKTPQISSVSKLSPAMEHLLNEMENYISIKSQTEVATIELQMNLKDQYEQFHGTTIRIDHYHSDPHSFHVLLTNPNQSAVEELTASLPTLLKTLETKFADFQINLLPPSYPKIEKTKFTQKIDKALREKKKIEQKTRQIERNPFLN